MVKKEVKLTNKIKNWSSLPLCSIMNNTLIKKDYSSWLVLSAILPLRSEAEEVWQWGLGESGPASQWVDYGLYYLQERRQNTHKIAFQIQFVSSYIVKFSGLVQLYTRWL